MACFFRHIVNGFSLQHFQFKLALFIGSILKKQRWYFNRNFPVFSIESFCFLTKI